MATLTITPGRPLKGTINVPGDKSVTHRAIILTALAEGVSTVTDYCRGEDCLNTMRAFQSLGVRIEETAERVACPWKRHVGAHGTVWSDRLRKFRHWDSFDDRLVGGARFFYGPHGDESIRRRPMGRVVKPLRAMGATIAGRKGGELAPLAITGTRLTGMSYSSPVASAQIKSSLLFAASLCRGHNDHCQNHGSRVIIPSACLPTSGFRLRRDGLTVQIEGRPSVGWSVQDGSRAGGPFRSGFFYGRRVDCARFGRDASRTSGSIPRGLACWISCVDMGAQIDVLNPREEAGEPVADLRVSVRPLRGVRIGPEQIPQTIDEFPILCVAAAVAEGETVITGAEELRVKESDRIATMATELRAMGARIEERPDGMVIQGLGRRGTNGSLTGATCTSHGDHRVAMSVAIGALTAAQPTVIQDTACIETSFPNFNRKLLELLTDSEKRL